MNRQIKSITVIKDLPAFKAGAKLCKYLNYPDTWGFSDLENSYSLGYIKKYPDFFEIEYEPKVLKRPDGSVISGLEEGQEIIFISEQGFAIQEWVYENEYRYKYTSADIWQFRLAQGLIFLPEDKDLAEKKAKMLEKKLEVQFEIDRLNAEDSRLTHILVMSSDGEVSYAGKPYIHSNYVAMSLQTAETILAKYSQDELQQYLGKII